MCKPLAIDLCCGLGGWTQGFLAEGYDVVGFDIERHQYGDKRYPAQLVLQDIRTLHGSQFRGAAVIVASPPCQAYSYRAMPWKRAKALGPPDNELFDTCFRIAREAAVPIVVENVVGAQKWVGRAAWHYGSYYLWGDVPALMPTTLDGRKNDGGSWFNIAHNTDSGVGQNPVERIACGLKVPGIKFSEVGFNVAAAQRYRANQTPDGIKQGGDWFGKGEDMPISRRTSSRSDSRKAASAMIAEIPFNLAQWIARVFKP